MVTARTVQFIMNQNSVNYTTEILVAAGALAVCMVNFTGKKKKSEKYNDTIAGGSKSGTEEHHFGYLDGTNVSQSHIFHRTGARILLWQNIFNS